MCRPESIERFERAVSALNAVRGLCIDAAESRALNHTDPDDLAFLLGLIVDELRGARAA